MNLAPLRLVLLTLTLAACSQSEPPVPEFKTVTIDLREAAANIPLPTRKPGYAAADTTIQSHEPTVVAAAPAKQDIVSPAPMGPDGRIIASPQTVASSEYGSVTRYFKRWLPDFNKITDCPSGVTCQAAFAN